MHRQGATHCRPGKGISTARSMKRLSGDIPALERRAINERLKSRAGLASGLHDMIELIGLEVAAADPRLDVAGGRINGDKARL